MDPQPHRPIDPSQSTLPPAPGIAPATGPSGVEILIPYKNGFALTAYYLAVFSLIGGALLGIPAVIFGILGIKRANAHPEVRGAAHAWVGVLLGGLTTIASVAVVAYVLRAVLKH